jgi:hypothetical protein
MEPAFSREASFAVCVISATKQRERTAWPWNLVEIVVGKGEMEIAG